MDYRFVDGPDKQVFGVEVDNDGQYVRAIAVYTHTCSHTGAIKATLDQEEDYNTSAEADWLQKVS